jgi:hypothetical protein
MMSHLLISAIGAPAQPANWPGFAGALGFFSFLAVATWQIAATRRARLGLEKDKAYEDLTTKYSDLLDRYTELQIRTIEGLNQTKTSMTSIEDMLREVG